MKREEAMQILTELFRMGGNPRKIILTRMPSDSYELEIEPTFLDTGIIARTAKSHGFNCREKDQTVIIF